MMTEQEKNDMNEVAAMVDATLEASLAETRPTTLQELSLRQRGLLAHLEDASDSDGLIHASMSEVGAQVGTTQPGLRALVAELEDAGFIKLDRRHRPMTWHVVGREEDNKLIRGMVAEMREMMREDGVVPPPISIRAEGNLIIVRARGYGLDAWLGSTNFAQAKAVVLDEYSRDLDEFPRCLGDASEVAR